MIVEIHAIQRESWHELPKDKSIAQAVTFSPAIDPVTMRYRVDIDEKLLSEIQQRTGYDLSLQATPGKQHPFWDTAIMKIKLPRNTTTVREIKNDIDWLWLGVLKGSGLVAPSESEIPNYPRAHFFIYSEEEDILRKEKGATLVMNAIKKMDKLTDSQKRGIVRILTNRRQPDRSAEFINTVLYDLITKDPTSFLEYANMTPTRVKTLILIEESTIEGYLQKEGTSYFYGADRIGFTRQEAADFLEQPNNQPMRLHLMTKCNLE